MNGIQRQIYLRGLIAATVGCLCALRRILTQHLFTLADKPTRVGATLALGGRALGALLPLATVLSVLSLGQAAVHLVKNK